MHSELNTGHVDMIKGRPLNCFLPPPSPHSAYKLLSNTTFTSKGVMCTCWTHLYPSKSSRECTKDCPADHDCLGSPVLLVLMLLLLNIQALSYHPPQRTFCWCILLQSSPGFPNLLSPVASLTIGYLLARCFFQSIARCLDA
jgi:hypothetical protein